MKKHFLIVFVFLISCNLSVGQDITHTQSNHSISANLFGLDYAYEQSLGGSWSILGRVGFEPIEVGGYTDDHDESHYQFSPRPALSIEPRYYFNLVRRARNGCNIDRNAADFLSVKALTAKLYSGHRDDIAFCVSAQYGIRRVWDCFYIEPSIGITYHAWFKDWLPEIQFRFGYSF